MAATTFVYTFNNTNLTCSIKEVSSIANNGVVIIPDTITYNDKVYAVTGVANEVFQNSLLVKEIHIGRNITSIGERAFKGCVNLEKTYMGKKVNAIQHSAFTGCTGLKGVYIEDMAAWMAISHVTGDANPLYYAHNLYLNGKLVEDLVIPKEATAFKYAIFVNCTSLRSVTIPNDAKLWYLGISGFQGCTNLQSVTFGYNITKISRYAFSGCSNLKSLYIPKSVTTVDYQIFWDCRNATVQCEFSEDELPIAIYNANNNATQGWHSKWHHYNNSNGEIKVHYGVSKPKNDTDFLGFRYNGYHSIDDLKIFRTSSGGRYDITAALQSQDKTAQFSGYNGNYFLGSYHTKRNFSVPFAFDNLKEEDIRKLKTVFCVDKPQELIFDECPYKIYEAKISQPLQLSYVCFDDHRGERVYKGTGTINFVCFNPYAHTPKYTYTYEEIFTGNEGDIKNLYAFSQSGGIINFYQCDANGNIISQIMDWTISYEALDDNFDIPPLKGSIDSGFFGISSLQSNLHVSTTEAEDADYTKVVLTFNGKDSRAYWMFDNREEFLPASGLTSWPQIGENPGDLPAPFVFTIPYSAGGDLFKVGELEIDIPDDCYNVKWDSTIGVVSATSTSASNDRKAIYAGEKTLGGIPVGGLSSDEILIDEGYGGKLEYDYWYY